MTKVNTDNYLATLEEHLFTDLELSQTVESIKLALNQANQSQPDPFMELAIQDKHILSILWQKHQSEYKNIQEFFHQMEVIISKLKLSTIYLAYRPNSNQIKEICQLLRGKLGSHLFLKTEYQPYLTAGFLLEHNGKRYNYSLSKSVQ